jgi:hypothetical protein
MQPIRAVTLCEEFKELRNRFPSNIDSIPDPNIVTITNMSPIYPSIGNFELITMLMHIDVDCYCTVVIDGELHTVKLRHKENMKYYIDDSEVPDGLIYCARYNSIVRGHNLRPKNRQCINSIAIQSYYSNRNISVKISSDNIQFCGPTSEDDCAHVLEIVSKHLNGALSDIQFLNENQEQLRSIIPRIPDMKFKKTEFYPGIREEWLDAIEGDPVQDRMREIILRVGIGSRTSNILKNRLNQVLRYLKGAQLPDSVVNGGLNIVMMKSSYRLPYAFPFIEFYNYLSTLPGIRYTVQYNPDVIQKMKIFILRYDNDYQYLDECDEDMLLPYDTCFNDESTSASISMMDESPFSQIETISIASTFFVNQISFSTTMLRETRSMFMSILQEFMDNHATILDELE